jgi:glycosyltransferase involved in cell wall biosynthesis
MPIKILSLSSVFPTPEQPRQGPYVKWRLEAMAKVAEIAVAAPVRVLDYSNGGRKGISTRFRKTPSYQDGRLRVLQPRWIYPPMGTPVNVATLALCLLWPLLRLRRNFRFQLIDAHFGYPEGTAAVFLSAVFRVPFVVTLRGLEQEFERHNPLRHRCMGWALRRAALVIAVSENLRRVALRLGVDPSRAVTIPNGVDTARFHPLDRDACRRKHGLPLDSRLIVAAGELIEAKGHQHVVAGLRAALDRGVDARLVIAGKTMRGGVDYERQLRDRVAALNLGDRVTFAGLLDQTALAELCSAADVFCLASWTEGWPNVIQEALACGAPVVASRVGGVPEMLPGADYGFIVEPRDEPALAAALELALKREWDRRKIADWGRRRSWDNVGLEVCDHLRHIVSAKAAEPPAGVRTSVRN